MTIVYNLQLRVIIFNFIATPGRFRDHIDVRGNIGTLYTSLFLLEDSIKAVAFSGVICS